MKHPTNTTGHACGNPTAGGWAGTNALCFVDESGFVGFAETAGQVEHSQEGFGLIAGLMLPETFAAEYESELEALFAPLVLRDDRKRHACEVFRHGENPGIRDDLFRYLGRRMEWVGVYEALFGLGVYQHNQKLDDVLGEVRTKHSLPKPSRLRAKSRIYTLLLRGVIFQIDEICRCSGVSSVEVLTDPLDEGLLKEAHSELDELRHNRIEREIKGWSEETGPRYGRISIDTPGFDNRTSRVKGIRISSSFPNLVFAADILANTLRYHIRQRVPRMQESPALHDEKILEGFPLVDRFAFLQDDYFTDRVYRPS